MRNKILAVIFGVGLLGCVIWLSLYFIGKNRADAELDGLKDAYVEAAEPEAVPTNEEAEDIQNENTEKQDEEKETVSDSQEEERVTSDLSGFDVPDKKIDFSALQSENADIYSWITIPGTPIDYPVVQSADELDYYLMHNLNGSYGYPGCIYTQYYNAKDWQDNHTVIYGHNMKDGTMFTALHRYKDEEFFKENPYVYIYTEKEILVYQIFAAYETSDVHLLLAFNTEDADSYEGYLKGILENEESMSDHFDRSLNLNGKDKIISMETCIGNKPARRYLVQAVLVARAEI